VGIDFLDAPVSGGTGGAIAGTLTFIVGGSDDAFAKAEPILAVMGKNIFHAGEHGAGQVAKICNNMLLGILMAGTAEAINLGVKNGLDPKVLSDIMLQSSGRNWRSEEHTSELQSRFDLVCRPLLVRSIPESDTLCLHDALPICYGQKHLSCRRAWCRTSRENLQ